MHHHAADTAWIVLAVGVVAYELGAPQGELMSEGVDRYLTRRPGRRRDLRPWVTRAVITTTAAHLLNLLPQRVDPFYRVAALFGR
jgi:hypothetical protein